MKDYPRISGNGNDFLRPAFSAALNELDLVTNDPAPLTVARENKFLHELGFGEWDYQEAFVENLKNAYAAHYVQALKSYLVNLDINLQRGTCLTFRGINGGGKTNGMATIVREIMRRKFDPTLGYDGRVKIPMFYTTATEMAEHAATHDLGKNNIYNVIRLLIIDDLGRLTELRSSAFSHIISERSKQMGKPFFITTALSDRELGERYQHVYSRLRTGLTVVTNDKDLRCLRK